MIVFPKQICKWILPDTGESRSDKTFFLKTNMELEVCTSLGSMFHRRGALFVKEIRPANDAGWNGRKSPCCRPRVPCWCSWKLSFSRSNAGADCWWQCRMVVNSCRDQWWDERVSFKFPVSGKTSSWGWTPARHRTAFLQSARSRSCWPVGMNVWLLKQHTPNLVESLRRRIAFLPWGSIACTYDVKHQFCGQRSCRLSRREVIRKGCHQW